MLSLLLSLAPLGTAATYLGTLSCWYADYKDKYGNIPSIFLKWEKSPTYSISKLNSAANDSTFPLMLESSNAFNTWGSVLSLDMQYSYSTPDISVFGGNLSELEQQGISLGDDVLGLTLMGSLVTQKGYYTYGNTQKELKIYGGDVKIGVLYIPGTSYKQYTSTIIHEIGHAMGWYGHSSNSMDVMYPYNSEITALTSRDKNHLKQVY